MTRPIRRRSDEARLDDLLAAGAPMPPLPRREDRLRLPVILLLTIMAAAAISALLAALRVTVPFFVVAALCVGVVLLRRAVRAVAEPGWLRAGDLVASPRITRPHEPGGWYAGGDGMVAAVRQWDRRLDWGLTHPDRFVNTTLPRLGELVDERLRQRHGITRASDPARARELLGENLWALLAPRTQVPSHKQIIAAIADLERL
jgi:hypothetical protein